MFWMLKAASIHILISEQLIPGILTGADSWPAPCSKLDEQLAQVEARILMCSEQQALTTFLRPCCDF